MKLAGRKHELKRLSELLNSNRAEFLALYGRRRVGKTYLIREFLRDKPQLNFTVTGLHNASKQEQLNIFKKALENIFHNGIALPSFKSWQQALGYLTDCLGKSEQFTKHGAVIFLDELPWLATPRSGLLEAIDQFWNTKWIKLSGFKLIICGSAASWTIKNIVNAKGGLHNRLTASIRLMPFSLSETEDFFLLKRINFNRQQLLEIFMALGGVPYYLDLIRPNMSASQNIGSLCFGNGELSQEYNKLFASLFTNFADHQKIVKALAKSANGLSRAQIAALVKLTSSGQLTDRLNELKEAGFIEVYVPFGKTHRDLLYRLIDNFVCFHHRWIVPSYSTMLPASGADYWSQLSQAPAFYSWAGLAFENICLQHHDLIKKRLGFGAVQTWSGHWRYLSKSSARGISGTQIDLLYDRADKVITLCEIKFRNDPLVISQKLIDELLVKKTRFQAVTGTRKQINLCLLTASGIIRNQLAEQYLSGVTGLDDLFE